MSSPLRLALAAALGLLALPALAQDKPTLTIYTYDGFAAEWGAGPGLKQGFEAQCGCTVDFVAADSSIGALRRVQLEGDSTKADIVLGLDTSLAGEAAATGLFAEHGVDTSALSLPNNWTSDIFVPFDYGYFAFIYNSEKLENPPRSFEELAGMDKNFKIIIQDPRSATPGMGLMLWVKAAYGDDANEAWADLAPHVLTMTKDWSSAYTLFLNGEADMVLSYSTSPAYHLIAEDDPRYKAAKFSEGHYTQIEVAGVLKSSPHQQLAKDFLAYLITPAAQSVIPLTNWMYPVAKVDLPEGYETMIAPDPALLMDDATVTSHSAGWIDEMLAALQ